MTRTMKGIAAVISVMLLGAALAYAFGAGMIGPRDALRNAATLTTVSGGAFTYMLNRPGVDWVDDPAPAIMLAFGIFMGGVQYVASYFI